jgi:flagellar motor switch protein FliN/FliY
MPADIESILQIEVPVIVQIGNRRMTVLEVMNLAPGAIIELPKNADDELDVLVNNRAIGFGSAVKVGENFGLRITRIGALTERIEALGTSEEEIAVPDELNPVPTARDEDEWAAH